MRSSISLRALVLRRGVSINELATESERRQEVGIAIERIYLGELSRLFESIVKRAGALEQLEFHDAQLNEASRCYLYGFFKGAVLLSSSALEKCLTEAIGQAGLDQVRTKSERQKRFYGPLVEEAAAQGILGDREQMGQDPLFASYCREVFDLRNRVAHKGYEPESREAVELVTKTRQVIEFIRDRQSSGP